MTDVQLPVPAWDKFMQKPTLALTGVCEQGRRSTMFQQINLDSPCLADRLILCKTWSSTGMPRPKASFGSHQATAVEPGGTSRPASRGNVACL